MKHLIRKCCECNRYTLRKQCPICNAPTIDPHPAKYSPDDKYVRYRIADRYSQIDTDHSTKLQDDL
jgi:H/ACA ribonucleoprotein complex subunit 3